MFFICGFCTGGVPCRKPIRHQRPRRHIQVFSLVPFFFFRIDFGTSFFICFLLIPAPFWVHLFVFFHDFCMPFSSIFVVSIFHRFSDGCWSHFWCFFDTFSVRTYNILNHQKHLFFQWISMILPFRETWFLMIFLILFVTSFGIDFWWLLASILAPFWNPFGIKFHVLGWSFFWWICESICYRLLIQSVTQNMMFWVARYYHFSHSFSVHLYLLLT